MDRLSAAGSVASIVGAIVSIVTLVLVTRIRAAVKRYARHRHLTEIIDRIIRIPPAKDVLPDTTCSEIRLVLDTLRSHDFSRWSFLDRSGKSIAGAIEVELEGGRRRRILQVNLQLLRDELTVR
jgi:hypothetical protein